MGPNGPRWPGAQMGPKWSGPKWGPNGPGPKWSGPKWDPNGPGPDGPRWPGPRWAKMAQAQMGQDGPGPDRPRWPGPRWAKMGAWGKWFCGRMALPQGVLWHPQGEMDSKAVANPLDVPKSPKPTLENNFLVNPAFYQIPLGRGLAPVAAPCEPCPLESPQYKRALPCSQMAFVCSQ